MAKLEGLRVLVVDDDPDLFPLIGLGLRGCTIVTQVSAAHAIETLAREPIDVVVTDVLMTGMTGLELCQHVVANRPDVPVIVMTASTTLETAIAAIRVGAYDFITKPLHVDALRAAVTRAAERQALRAEVTWLRTVVSEGQQFGELVGTSPAMRSLFELLGKVAESDASLMITGESGTGKELVARGVHRRSRRSAGPLVSVNCAAIPEALLESELFGHARGAFTDARTARDGLFVQADGGTIFLDEIGELPLALQPKLLRALEERTVRPVGGDGERAFDARVVVATNRDLETAVERGTFRADLYYRVNVVQLRLPPLRERGRDVLLLAQHFLDRFAAESGRSKMTLSAPAAGQLLAYPWPGNVRELRNCIERVVALSRSSDVTLDELPDRVRDHRSSQLVLPTAAEVDLLPMEEVEKQYILRVLESLGGNKRHAAKVLGFDRRTLYRKLEKYGVVDAEST